MTDSEATLAARKSPGTGRNFRNKDQLSLQTMILPGIIFILVFTFIPLYGVLIAFKEYNIVTGIRGIFTAEWVGLANFKEFVNDINFWNMLRNTLGINLLGLLINFPLTILFALMLNELTSQHFKKLTQTVTYLPHFISWSIFGGLIINILSPSSGVVNYVLLQLGIISEPIHFLGEKDYFWLLAVLTNLVKELGWGPYSISPPLRASIRKCMKRPTWTGPHASSASGILRCRPLPARLSFYSYSPLVIS